jgi:hypothetical protein
MRCRCWCARGFSPVKDRRLSAKTGGSTFPFHQCAGARLQREPTVPAAAIRFRLVMNRGMPIAHTPAAVARASALAPTHHRFSSSPPPVRASPSQRAEPAASRRRRAILADERGKTRIAANAIQSRSGSLSISSKLCQEGLPRPGSANRHPVCSMADPSDRDSLARPIPPHKDEYYGGG